MVLPILIQYGTVTCVLQLNALRRLSFDRDGFANDAHILPAIEITVLMRILRIHLVYVQVFVILAEHSKAPAAELVVPNRDAGQHGLAAANHIPSRRDQVGEVPERWRDDRPVRIVDDEGKTRLSKPPAHNPVVRSDVVTAVTTRQTEAGNVILPSDYCGITMRRNDVCWSKLDGPAKRPVKAQNVIVQERTIDRRIKLQHGIAWPKPLKLLHVGRAHGGDRHAQPKLQRDIRQQTLVTRDHHSRRPLARLHAKQLELDRQKLRTPFRLGNVRVDAVDVRTNNRLAARMVVIELLLQILAEEMQSSADVPVQFAPSQYLCHGTRRLPPPQLELKEPVAGYIVALRKKQVMLMLRVDVRHTPAVDQNLDRFF